MIAAILLLLMCENVNAAPQVEERNSFSGGQVGATRATSLPPAGAAPFTLAHPLCQTGFTIAQRFDERNTAGAIVKSVWVRKCTNGRIVYGRKV